MQTFNVTEPDFYKEVEKQLNTVSLDDWKTYLRWHIAHANAPYLSSKFVNENFDFLSARRCAALQQTASALEALREPGGRATRRGARPGIRGRRAFTPEMKARPSR